jgi:hypothetical protein
MENNFEVSDLELLTTSELKTLLIDLFDGNAGEILYGFREMGITKDANLKSAIIRYIIRKQPINA